MVGLTPLSAVGLLPTKEEADGPLDEGKSAEAEDELGKVDLENDVGPRVSGSISVSVDR